MKFIELEEIDSTNEYIKRNIQTLEHLTIVQSHFQNKGKGRNGHIWESQMGDNLLLSFLIKEFDDPSKVHQVTQIAALSIIQTLAAYAIEAKIKWPNDIFVEGKKICGILVEAIFEEQLQGIIIGIGLNVNAKNYQSMYKCLHKTIDITKVRKTLITNVISVYTTYIQGGYLTILNTINQLSYLKDKKVEYQEYGYVTFKELQEDGTLLIEDENHNTFTLHVNEITLHQEN